MRPRADGAPPLFGAAFCWRHAAGGGAGERPGPVRARGQAHQPPAALPLALEFAGVCWVDFGAAPGPLARSRGQAWFPEGECAGTQGRPGLGRSGLRGRSWRAPGAAASLPPATSCRGRSHGLNAVSAPGSLGFLESEFSEVVKTGRDESLFDTWLLHKFLAVKNVCWWPELGY